MKAGKGFRRYIDAKNRGDFTYCCALALLLALISVRLCVTDLLIDKRRGLKPRFWSLSELSECFGVMFSSLSSCCNLLVPASTGFWLLPDRESVFSSSTPASYTSVLFILKSNFKVRGNFFHRRISRLGQPKWMTHSNPIY